MELILNNNEVNNKDIEIHQLVTTENNPYFFSGEYAILDKNKIAFWEKLNDGEFIVIDSEGLTDEEFILVKVTFTNDLIRLQSPSDYYEYNKTFSIKTIKELNVRGKLIYCIRELSNTITTYYQIGA